MKKSKQFIVEGDVELGWSKDKGIKYTHHPAPPCQVEATNHDNAVLQFFYANPWYVREGNHDLWVTEIKKIGESVEQVTPPVKKSSRVRRSAIKG